MAHDVHKDPATPGAVAANTALIGRRPQRRAQVLEPGPRIHRHRGLAAAMPPIQAVSTRRSHSDPGSLGASGIRTEKTLQQDENT
jgi:hypothetical protein